MSDLIERSQALNAINIAMSVSAAWENVAKLPSAQQQRILYANMSDAEFEKWLYEHGICNPNIHESIPCDVVPLLIDYAISELPSAQPERKRGKWIPVTNGRGGFECERCHCYAPSYQDGVEWLSAFCPNCGARMDRGESE